MKVIELLNRIANDEGVPIKIKYGKKIYEYQEGSYDYLYYAENNGTMLFLLTELFNTVDNILDILNIELKEVPLIEDKKIEKLMLRSHCRGTFEEEQAFRNRRDDEITTKINEIIEVINERAL